MGESTLERKFIPNFPQGDKFSKDAERENERKRAQKRRENRKKDRRRDDYYDNDDEDYE